MHINNDTLVDMIYFILDFGNKTIVENDRLTTDINGFFSTGSVGTNITHIMQTVTLPIGMSLLACMLLMEFCMIGQRLGGDFQSGFQIPMQQIIKTAIFVFLFSNIVVFQNAIITIGAKLAESMSTANLAPASTPYAIDRDAVQTTVNQLGVLDQLVLYIPTLLIYVLVFAGAKIINVIVNVRMIQIIMMMIFSPIPLAFLPNGELRGISLGYLKNFIATVLQAAVIVTAFKLFGIITQESGLMAVNGISTPQELNSSMWGMLGYLFLLLIVVLNSNKFAKSIVNAM